MHTSQAPGENTRVARETDAVQVSRRGAGPVSGRAAATGIRVESPYSHGPVVIRIGRPVVLLSRLVIRISLPFVLPGSIRLCPPDHAHGPNGQHPPHE